MNQLLPSPELLRKLLRYDPETGKLFWLERTSDLFVDGKHTAQRRCKRWNSMFSGKEAFTATDNNGYKISSVNNMMQRAHRVIWAMHYGTWPENQIDHINGCASDNRIENLQDVTNRVNQRNRKLNNNNTSGFHGVVMNESSGNWKATIKTRDKLVYLGTFSNKERRYFCEKSRRI